MKERWNHLALREKQMLILGAVFVGLFLIYLLIWSPLSNATVDLRNKIKRNQILLSWMQEADKRIQMLEKKPVDKKQTSNTGSLLTIIQKQINRTPLVSSLTQLHQVDNDSVQLAFQKVDFDQLTKWLIDLIQQQNLVITQMSVVPSATPGIVAAEIVLKK